MHSLQVSDVQAFEVLSAGTPEAPPAPRVEVTQPGAEETWDVGRVVNVTWSTTWLSEDTLCELQLWNKARRTPPSSPPPSPAPRT